MSSDPKPEHRISNLEKEFMQLGSRIEETASDSAEEFKAVRQDIKQLDLGIRDSYKSIGDTFIALGEDLDTVMATMSTKDDISRLETRIETTLVTKDELRSELNAMESRLIDAMKMLFQQRPGGEN